MEQPDRKSPAPDARLKALIAFDNGQRTGAFDQWLRNQVNGFRVRHEGIVTSPTYSGDRESWHY
ncbi:MAG: hypothetical protein PHE68_01380 [Candidatus Peribacteraceae bacterium]|nr:hypothetical protein [Candidatus Peribacteraceae bacterium]MDD5074560.1 hypothetical protein [Candidatus Peribacteraceae bacterium]